MELPESSHRPLSSFQGSPRRPRHRVDAGEPRGCFSYFQNHNNHQSLDFSSAATANRMLSEYSHQQLLREMLERQPKIGFEEAAEDTVKVNGCKKRKLYQPLRNGGEISEPAPSPQLPSLHQSFNAPPSLHSWKESFKSTLLSSISDLVDTQFQSLFETLPIILPPAPPPPTQPPPHANSNNLLKVNHRFFKPPLSQPTLQPSPHFTSALVNINNNYQASREDCESPLSLVVTPKKKRHKVTDTRLTPRAVSRLLDGGPTYIDGSPPPVYSGYPGYASPPASLKEFVQSQISGNGNGSGSGGGNESDASLSNEDSSNYVGPSGGSSATLTPMHLRKAKLMFFWVRYPSSAVLKMYFPDIKFNKNNTAQLVKWFSNFREFYYIQMEKYARQALSEGVKNAEEIHVSVDHELYRVLNLHYNRNNHIEVPSNFRFVVEQTLREFFKAIQTGKDSEQSWKKAIYKIIARLDDPVPDYFKSPNFLEQLE